MYLDGFSLILTKVKSRNCLDLEGNTCLSVLIQILLEIYKKDLLEFLMFHSFCVYQLGITTVE